MMGKKRRRLLPRRKSPQKVPRLESDDRVASEVARRSQGDGWAGACRVCHHVADVQNPDDPRTHCPECGVFAFDAFDEWAIGRPAWPRSVPKRP